MGCAAGTDDGPGEGIPLKEPSLQSIAPQEITLGDQVKVIGRDFPDREVGRMALHLAGTYTDSSGTAFPFEGDFPLAVENPSVASFVMDDIYFSPNRDKIGTFSGTAALVVTSPEAEEVVRSRDLTVNIRILPSIRAERLRAAGKGCAEVTGATTSEVELELGFAAIGFGEASTAQPWKVKLSYLAPQVSGRYLVPDAYDFWPVELPDSNEVSAIAPDGLNSIRFEVPQGSRFLLDPRNSQHRVQIHPPVSIGQELHDEVVIQRFATGVTRFGGKDYANFVVEIDAGDGRVLRRSVTMDIWSEVEIGHNATERMVKIHTPESTSGCSPGGSFGIDLNYTEGESSSRTRTLDFRWDASAGTSLGFNLGPIVSQLQANQNWNESFGVSAGSTVSSESHTSQNLQAHILPSYFGMSYRQVWEFERTVELTYHSVCGASGVIGEAVLTDWEWGFDVAQGPECPPPTNLPPAESFPEE